MDATTFVIRQMAEGAFFTTHTGTHAMWHPDGSRVYFYRSADTVEAVDRFSGRTVLSFKGVLRQFRPDGGKISWTAAIGRPGMPAGLYWTNEDGTGSECLASTADLYRITPNRDQFGEGDMHLKNAKWSPDGRRLLVANGVWDAPFVNRPGLGRSLYLVDVETGEKKWICYFGHHHSWAPDSRFVVFCANEGLVPGGRVPRVWIADSETGDMQMMTGSPLAGHPVLNADGTLLATEDDDGILVLHRHTREVERIASYTKSFVKTHRGTHSHCTWNADGTQLLYNSAETGTSQLYLVSDLSV